LWNIFNREFISNDTSGVFQIHQEKIWRGRRVFLMSPLHHHFQKKGWHESKIVARFWIIGVMLAIISIITLKLR
jgi:phospho-N-acetylmuramoyl-pentapeptide-transferase